jgi:hypothetical protein
MTLLVTAYPSKKALKESVGKPLSYFETSAFGPEYRDNGEFSVAHRPYHPQCRGVGGREFFARVTMRGGLIAKVE